MRAGRVCGVCGACPELGLRSLVRFEDFTQPAIPSQLTCGIADREGEAPAESCYVLLASCCKRGTLVDVPLEGR